MHEEFITPKMTNGDSTHEGVQVESARKSKLIKMVKSSFIGIGVLIYISKHARLKDVKRNNNNNTAVIFFAVKTEAG